MIELKNIRRIICLSIIIFPVLHAQQSADDILAKLDDCYKNLNDYTVSMKAKVDLENMRVPEMQGKVYFKRPDKIHFESTGFAMLPKEGVFNPLQFTKDKTGKILGQDTIENIVVLKMLLEPKEKKKGSRVATIYVDTARWIVLRAELQPYQSRNIRVDFSYAKVADWWMPVHIEVVLDVKSSDDTSQPDLPISHPGMPRMSAPRKGKVTIDYSDYKVNQGIPDEIFVKDKQTTK